MKTIITSFVFCTIVLLISSVSADNKNCPKKINATLIRDETNSILNHVKLIEEGLDNFKNNCGILVEIINPNVTAIADDAFAYLGITNLLIENDYQGLNLTDNSFRGLTQLKTLKINTPIKSSNYKQLFEPISGLKHLALSIHNNSEVLGETLPVLGELTSLFIFDYRSWKIDNKTFTNAAKTITNLTIFGSEIEVIRENSFSTMKKLKVLKFQHSKLTKIEPGTFNNLNLISLQFTENNWNKIESQTFAGLDVDYLQLWNRNAIEIESGAFENSTIGHLVFGPGRNTSVDDTTRSAWGLSTNTKIYIPDRSDVELSILFYEYFLQSFFQIINTLLD